MKFLERERLELERFLPGLDDRLGAIPFTRTERPGNPAIPLLREAGGPRLAVPTGHGGLGASPRALARIQRALGSRSPSLAVASAMHHFSVATIAEAAAVRPEPGLEAALLGAIAGEDLWLASGFAEGRPGVEFLASGLSVEPAGGGWSLTGSKRPCSLSRSMGLLTASLVLPDGRPAVAAIPAGTPGLFHRPFWSGGALGGAESDEVVLERVLVAEDQVAPLDGDDAARRILERGLVHFQLVLAATYAGIAAGLVERLLTSGRGSPADRARLVGDLEGAAAAIDDLALAIETDPAGDFLERSLLVRHAVLTTIVRATSEAALRLGGIAFASGPEIAERVAAVHALAYHPPGLAGVAVTRSRHAD